MTAALLLSSFCDLLCCTVLLCIMEYHGHCRTYPSTVVVHMKIKSKNALLIPEENSQSSILTRWQIIHFTCLFAARFWCFGWLMLTKRVLFLRVLTKDCMNTCTSECWCELIQSKEKNINLITLGFYSVNVRSQKTNKKPRNKKPWQALQSINVLNINISHSIWILKYCFLQW